MEFDHHLSLEQLENIYWEEPVSNSNLIDSCHRLRKVPINKLVAGDLRLLIGQGIGLDHLIYVATQILSEDPFICGTYFKGDLLKSVLKIPKSFWDAHQDCFFALSEIMTEVENIHDSLSNYLIPMWECLDSDATAYGDYKGDKVNLINKYSLKLENGAWYSQKENSHKHLIFKDSFVKKQDLIGLLFRINKLCMAKVKYFRQHIDDYEPCKYDFRKGFITVPLWDSEFLRHKASGYILDYRFLQSITVYSEFLRLCEELEMFCKQ